MIDQYRKTCLLDFVTDGQLHKYWEYLSLYMKRNDNEFHLRADRTVTTT